MQVYFCVFLIAVYAFLAFAYAREKNWLWSAFCVSWIIYITAALLQ